LEFALILRVIKAIVTRNDRVYRLYFVFDGDKMLVSEHLDDAS